MADDERGWLAQVLSGMRTSQLAWALLALFLLDLVVLDPFPFVDEALLALATLLVARWRGRDPGPDKPPPKDVTPRGH